MENQLYYGDNLDVLRKYVKDESIDLIYLDPPFNSQANYNVLFKEAKTEVNEGEKSKAQIEAFTDSWTWDDKAQITFEYLTSNKNVPSDITELILAFEHFLGKNSMSAYIVMMTVRLLELHRVLKKTGSLYLHCDPTASHYIKLVLDSVFGVYNFRNEIIWKRTVNPKGSQYESKKFGKAHDTIFFYSKTNDFTFNLEEAKVSLTEEEISKKYHLHDEKGSYYVGPVIRSQSMGERPNLVYEYKGYTPDSSGWRMTKEKLIELDNNGDLGWSNSGKPYRKLRPKEQEGKPIFDIWDDINRLYDSKESLNYATQKPLKLLERIINASSNKGDLILDPFCGCGTTIDASEKLERKWIGIDITHLAINLIKRRIRDKYPNSKFEVIGEPKDLEGAKELAQTDRYQFEWWALSLVDARPINDKKKGSDRGIDGIIYLRDPNSQKTRTVLIQVKSGHVNSSYIRDFKGTLEREKAKFGIFITLEEPTKDMKEEAITYGSEVSPLNQERVPKIQILTIEDLLKEVRPKVLFLNISYKKAEHKKEKKSRKPKPKKVGRYKKLS